MRVGSFWMTNVWERGANFNRLASRGAPLEALDVARFDPCYEHNLDTIYKFFEHHRQPDDPDPVTLMCKFFPNYRPRIEQWACDRCRRALEDATNGDDDQPPPF